MWYSPPCARNTPHPDQLRSIKCVPEPSRAKGTLSSVHQPPPLSKNFENVNNFLKKTPTKCMFPQFDVFFFAYLRCRFWTPRVGADDTARVQNIAPASASCSYACLTYLPNAQKWDWFSGHLRKYVINVLVMTGRKHVIWMNIIPWG